MKRLLILLGCLIVGACTQPAPNVRGQITPQILAGVTQPFLLVEASAIDAAATLVVVSNHNGVVDWRTGDNASLAFRQGVVVGTRGLGDDLMTADVTGTIAMIKGRGAASYPRFVSRLDGEYQTEFESFVCQPTGRTPETFNSFGRLRQTVKITEVCGNPARRFENIYWVGPDGTMWKSRQWVSPNIQYVETERLVR